MFHRDKYNNRCLHILVLFVTTYLVFASSPRQVGQPELMAERWMSLLQLGQEALAPSCYILRGDSAAMRGFLRQVFDPAGCLRGARLRTLRKFKPTLLLLM